MKYVLESELDCSILSVCVSDEEQCVGLVLRLRFFSFFL